MPKTSSTSKSIAKSVAAPSSTATPAKLKSFRQTDADHPEFSFTRYWWEGEGLRSGITPWVHKKMRPGDDPHFGWAAKIEVLLPPAAPSDYMDVEFLLKQFDSTLPPFERHVMIQVKIALSADEPWHAGYERVRGYARAHFAEFPIVPVVHVPSTAGLNGYGSHVHCIVLSRPLTINGLQGACHHLCSDRGYADALAAWQAWNAEEFAV